MGPEDLEWRRTAGSWELRNKRTSEWLAILRPYDAQGQEIGYREGFRETSPSSPVWGFKLWTEQAWVVAHTGMTLDEAKATAEACVLMGLTGKDFE